jgi:acyl-coenzyme A synthetase/AMP-(fatty) acid ligase
VNNFGSSETGPLGQYFVDKDTKIPGNIVPVHLRVEDKEIFLVDESTMPDENGVIGEIAVRSQYMSPGYWSKSDQGNAKHFVEDANTSRTFLTGDFGKMGSDGMLVYVGRKDNQVNIRGFRVDLTEIEANIRNLGVCQDVAVLAQQLGEEESRLVAYVVLTQDLMQSDHDLRSKLLNILPSYMIPTEFIFLESLPRTASGKVDRLALPSNGQDRVLENTRDVAPRNDLERELTKVCENLLEVNALGIQNSFWDLGGDSMFAIQLSNRICTTWGTRLTIGNIFEHPTVEELAAFISSRI